MIVEIYFVTFILGVIFLLLGSFIRKARLLTFIGLGFVLYFPYQIIWAIFTDLFLKWILMTTIWETYAPTEKTFFILFIWPPVIACILTTFLSAWLYLRYQKSVNSKAP